MANPTVSIVMATHNDESYIEQAINSVIEQNFSEWEIVIVNDASTDRTSAKVASLAAKDDRIRLVDLQSNIGQAPALNLGLNLSKGRYIARIDGDDYWTDQNKLTAQVNFLETNSDYALVGTQGVAVDVSGNELFKLEFPLHDSEIRKQILTRNCFIHSSVMFRSDTAREIGWYRNTEGKVEDYELWLEMGKNHKFAVLASKALCYRINPAGITQTKTDIQWQAFINLSNRYRDYYPGYYKARLKLQTQKTLLKIFGPKFLTLLKKIIFS